MEINGIYFRVKNKNLVITVLLAIAPIVAAIIAVIAVGAIMDVMG